MLKKLMKHELRATGRTMVPMLACVLAAAIGGNIAINRLLEADSAPLNAIGGFLMVVYVSSVMAACIMTFALMVNRFYKNLLQDEGYVMMTLPVSVHEHILSKLLVSLIWWFAVAAVGFFSLFILAFNMDWFKEIFTILPNLRLSEMTFEQNPLHIVFFLLELALMLTAIITSICLILYASMAAGHGFSSRKGILSVIVAFIVLNVAFNTLEHGVVRLLNFIGLDGFRLWFNSLPSLVQMHLMPLGVTGLFLIPSAIFYALTAYCLKYRLNLC